MDARELWLPLAHELLPIVGPGGLLNAVLSRYLGTDASRMVHVTRYADVAEIWQRDEDFSVRGYDERMTETTGPFILGMNEPGRYTPEAAILGRAVRREDAALVQRLVAEETASAIGRFRHTGRIDAIRDVADPVCIRFAQRYFGLEGPEPIRLLRLFQVVSWYIFTFFRDPVMRKAAASAAEELGTILDGIIQRRRAEGHIGDGDIMGRLLATAKDFRDGDHGVARSIAGLASGTLNAPIGLFANALNKLLGLDESTLARVRELARSAASGSADDAALLSTYVDEAERFGVFPSVLYRHAERDAVIAAGTPRETRIPEGCTVVVWPSLGAFDAEVFDNPFAFQPGRPRQKYLSFGYGRHRCLGEHIGQALVHQMMQGLFALPGLRRAEGKAGRLVTRELHEANFPDGLVLEFDKPS